MKTLFRSYDTEIESAYIIRIKNNETSEKLAARCINSCENVDMPYKIWDAYDGTQKDISIVPPEHSANCPFMSIIKVMDNCLTKAEVSCALSHISLWFHCAKIDKPIVVLEHDAIMLQKITQFPGFNTILYLGCVEWAKYNWPIMQIPLHGTAGPNRHFILRTHAYAIDPIVAKNMLSTVLKMGIYNGVDIMMAADLYNISHIGCVAYDQPDETTMSNRHIKENNTVTNDDLQF